MKFGRLGLRAQFALALIGVLVLAATLTMLAIYELFSAPGMIARKRLGITLTRAVAGEVALTPDIARLEVLLRESIGEGGLRAAAMVDLRGKVIARAGTMILRGSRHPPPHDDIIIDGEVMAVMVLLPSQGVFVAETSLAPSASERVIPKLVLSYTLSAGALSLVVVYLLLTRWIVRPVEGLTVAAERVAAGRRDVRAEERGAAEVERAASAFNRMTEQLRTREEELSQRVRELERTTRDLQRAQEQVVRGERLAMVGRLAAGIAHEVGNPLAAIVGLADVMREGGLDDENREFAGRIGREAQRIHRTVRELLDYARANPRSVAPPREDGTPVARVDVGDVAEAVDQVTRLLRPQKSMREVALTTSVAPDLRPVMVSSDRLVQVVLNLCMNAVDAIHGAGRSGSVAVRARQELDRVVIEIEDDGPGIPEALRQKVFEPFFSTKPAGEGTGLGLATLAVIVEQAGGSLTAHARRDDAEGARMVVELPVVGARIQRDSLV